MRISSLLALLVAGCSTGDEDDRFAPLGTSEADVVQFGLSAGQLSFASGEVRCAAGNFGWWETRRPYANYTLRLEYRFPAGAGNSGTFVHMRGERKIWPACIEVQGFDRDVGRIFTIGGAPAISATDDPAARASAKKPAAEWNTIEIVSRDGAITSLVNGVKVASSEPGELRDGPIGFQCEGAEVHWRNVVIRED